MPSELRTKIREQMEQYSNELKLSSRAKVLDVGIGGDKKKPSENFKYFPTKRFKTMDIDPQWRPDFVGDICETEFASDYWDLVILSQTLEHVWDYKKAVEEIYRITKKYAIIDMPFMYPYHPEPGFDDFWRFSPTAIKNLLKDVGFQVKVELIDNLLTTALCQK